jgi:hypothetical protein
VGWVAVIEGELLNESEWEALPWDRLLSRHAMTERPLPESGEI